MQTKMCDCNQGRLPCTCKPTKELDVVELDRPGEYVISPADGSLFAPDVTYVGSPIRGRFLASSPSHQQIPREPAPSGTIDLVFSGELPDATFVEAEDGNGNSINIGEWFKREDGYSVLRINVAEDQAQEIERYRSALESIATKASQSRSVTRRLAWIEGRAQSALENKPWAEHVFMMPNPKNGVPKAERLATENLKLKAELAALKAQPSGVVLPERMTIPAEASGYKNGYMRGRNDTIDEVARLNSSYVSTGDLAGAIEQLATIERSIDRRDARLAAIAESTGEPAKCRYQDDPRSPSELSLAGCNCVRFGEGNPHWPCKLHPAVSAGGVDERAAFKAAVSRSSGLEYLSPIDAMRHGWQARAALTAPAPNHSEQVRDGWQLVPVEPTAEMLKAARLAPIPAVYLDSMSAMADLDAKTKWSTMLAAAPSAGRSS